MVDGAVAALGRLDILVDGAGMGQWDHRPEPDVDGGGVVA
jgi:hypothetical protein